jgi:hypothetical protein
MQVGIIVGIYIDEICTITMDIVLQTNEISIRNTNAHIGSFITFKNHRANHKYLRSALGL